MDLVLNHTSDQHPWFQASRQDRHSPYREYYVWSDTDQIYTDARIIFVDTEQSNWTWDEVAGQYYWHRFYASQPDLNYDHPAVRAEVSKIVGFWLDQGVDGFRADAVPYLFERDGTNCENLPETHAYLKSLREGIDQKYPGRILLCEANQWPEDVRPYFGEGDEFHLGFHFPLMPRIYMALRKEDRTPIELVFQRTPLIPDTCQWATFLRNHDELTLEMVTPEEREWMWKEYAPEPRMRLNLGIRRRLAPLLDNNQKKIELAYSLIFTLPGTPVIYYGDEIGMGDNIWLFDRNGVRTPMQWDRRINGGFSSAEPNRLYAPLIEDTEYDLQHVNVEDQRKNPGSLFHAIKRMIEVRLAHPAFGEAGLQWLDSGNPAVAVYRRAAANEQLLILNNLSASPQRVNLSEESLPSELTDLLTGRVLQLTKTDAYTLEPYAYYWLLK
jgi:maltose alpha-D-glucosyltransferase/alpha-amylase